MSQIKNKFKTGDRVFAKIKGYPYWPATITEVDSSKKLKKYSVKFYGTNEVGVVREVDVCTFKENKSLYGNFKDRNSKFNAAMKEAEKSFNTSFKISNDKNDCDLKESGVISQANSMTEPSVYLSKKPCVTSTPINTQSKSSNSVSATVEINLTKLDKHITDDLNKQIILNDTASCDKQHHKALPPRNTMTLDILGNKWLEDDPINYYYELLSSSVTRNSNIWLMNPMISQAIKCVQDYQHLLYGVNLQEKTHILIPVNDSPAVDKPGGSGSHWSLMLYVAEIKEFFYFDSLGLFNYEHAVKISSNMQNLVSKNSTCKITPISVPKQLNGYDCGIYLIIFSELIIQGIMQGKDSLESLQRLFPDISNSTLILKRAQLAMLYFNPALSLNLSPDTVSQMMIKSPTSTVTHQCSGKAVLNHAPASIPITIMANAASHSGGFTKDKHVSSYTSQKQNCKAKDQWVKVFSHKEKNISQNKPGHPLSITTGHPSTKNGGNHYSSTFNVSLNNRFQPLSATSTNITEEKTPSQNNKESQRGKISKIKKYIKPIQNVYNPKKQAKINFVNKFKLSIYSDSQGRNLTSSIEQLDPYNIQAISSVMPNAGLIQVVEVASQSSLIDDITILIGGTNDTLRGNLQAIYSHLESKLKELSKNKPVIITTIPRRWDKTEKDPIHDEVNLLNLYIKELVYRLDSVYLVDLDSFYRQHYTKHGLHLNTQGKNKMAYEIGKTLLEIPKNATPIRIIETNMNNIIKKYQGDHKTAFAHCISADLLDDKNMSAGIARVFKSKFGRPTRNEFIASHIARQKHYDGVTIYSLVTKGKYFKKPQIPDYDLAFEQFLLDFKKKKLKRLFCSPMGCVRDNISIEHFAAKITHFQQQTGATVYIVTYDEQSHRVLRNGVPFSQFITRLQHAISSYSQQPAATKNTNQSNNPNTNKQPPSIEDMNSFPPLLHHSVCASEVLNGQYSECDKNSVITSQTDDITNGEKSLILTTQSSNFLFHVSQTLKLS